MKTKYYLSAAGVIRGWKEGSESKTLKSGSQLHLLIGALHVTCYIYARSTMSGVQLRK